MKPSTALKKAKRLLKEEGWIQNYAQSDDGWCAIAALANVTGATEEMDLQQNGEWITSVCIHFGHELFRRSLDYLAAGFGYSGEYTGMELMELNDSPVLDVYDIIHAYNIAIAIAKSWEE